MLPINIKTSKANQEIVSFLTQKLPGNVKENIIARLMLVRMTMNAQLWLLIKVMVLVVRVVLDVGFVRL